MIHSEEYTGPRGEHLEHHVRKERHTHHSNAHGPGGRHGRRRRTDAGQLRLVLLLLMEDQPRHGYDLMREIETRTGGAYLPSPGIIYPTLTLLEELAHVEAAEADGARRAYTLTVAGRQHLSEHRSAAEAGLKRLEDMRTPAGQIDAGPVWRAMQNLKAALGQRLGGVQDRQILFDAADLIDAAARQIERLP